MILPKLDYCNFVWNNLAPSRYNSLEWLQTRTARIALKDSNLSHYQLWGKCWEASALTTAPSLAPSPPPSTNYWRKCMEISWENFVCRYWCLSIEELSYLPSTMYHKASKEHNKQMMSEPKCLKVWPPADKTKYFHFLNPKRLSVH